MTYGSFLDAAARAKVVIFPADLEELKQEATRGFTLTNYAGRHTSA